MPLMPFGKQPMANSTNSPEQIWGRGYAEVPAVDRGKHRVGVWKRYQLRTSRSSGDQVMWLVPNPINSRPSFSECNGLKIMRTLLSHPVCWRGEVRFRPASREGEVEPGIAPL